MNILKRSKFAKVFGGIFVAAVLFQFVPTAKANAASLTQTQVNAVISLLQAFGADSTVVTNVQTALGGTSTTGIQPAPFQNLQTGSTGNNVTALQTVLKSLGYYIGTADGNYGLRTKSSVLNFQKRTGLKSTGIYDVATNSLLTSITQLNPTPISTNNSTAASQCDKPLNPDGSCPPIPGASLLSPGTILNVNSPVKTASLCDKPLNPDGTCPPLPHANAVTNSTPVQTGTTNFQLALISPNSGTFKQGQTVPIQWNGGNSSWPIYISLENESNTVAYQTIANSAPYNRGIYSWTIPTIVDPGKYHLYIEGDRGDSKGFPYPYGSSFTYSTGLIIITN